MKLVDVIEYLDERELEKLKHSLDVAGITYIVKQHAGASRYRSFYFKIAVSSEDEARSVDIVRRFKATQKIAERQCPKCGSFDHKKIASMNLILRLWYGGEMLVQCKKCEAKFGL